MRYCGNCDVIKINNILRTSTWSTLDMRTVRKQFYIYIHSGNVVFTSLNTHENWLEYKYYYIHCIYIYIYISIYTYKMYIYIYKNIYIIYIVCTPIHEFNSVCLQTNLNMVKKIIWSYLWLICTDINNTNWNVACQSRSDITTI